MPGSWLEGAGRAPLGCAMGLQVLWRRGGGGFVSLCPGGLWLVFRAGQARLGVLVLFGFVDFLSQV